jgi:TonB family protein
MVFESSVLSYLVEVTARSLCLAVLALAAIAILRVRTAAARHAAGTVVVAGMLLLAAFAPLAPPIPLRVLPTASTAGADLPEVVRIAQVADDPGGAPVRTNRSRWQWPSWQQTTLAVYLLVVLVLLARLSVGYLFTRRLVKGSVRTELGPGEVLESTWISVPLTVGTLRPKILLPTEWREWEPSKLAAVLAHERTHVRRADWAIALAAGINRCIFWFHPLAWWLERRLAALAEQACDDSALLEVGEREPYAQALLDMAAAVKNGHGRLVWEAMAMAKASEVNMRIERILDETRQIPRGVTRRRWAAVLACSLPLIYVASVVQLAPAQVQAPVSVAHTGGVPGMTSADASRMEQELVRNPDDLETRSKLIGYYFLNNVREPRLTHILWMVEHHPEAELSAFNSAGLSPQANSLNTVADYQRALSLWRVAIASHPEDNRILQNAAQFDSQPGGDWFEAERLLQKSRETPLGAGGANAALPKLATLYARGIMAPGDNNGFGIAALAKLESSTDGVLLSQVANNLKTSGGAGKQDIAKRLSDRAAEYGGPRTVTPSFSAPGAGSAPVPPAISLAQAPPILSRVDPQYPELARQARIQSDVNMAVTIGPDGHVRNLMVVSGHPLLIQSAMEALKNWTFAPALQNGAPVAATFPLMIPFRLDGGSGPLPGNVQPLATTPQPPMPSRIRVGGNVQMAMLQHRVDPVYPAQALTAGPDGGPLEGTVRLNVVIAKDGTVQSVQPIEGHPLLAVAVEAAVQQWIYRPTLLNGNPVEVVTTVELTLSAPK